MAAEYRQLAPIRKALVGIMEGSFCDGIMVSHLKIAGCVRTLAVFATLPAVPWLTAAALCQVETLAGQVVAVDVDAGATLGAMREGIARQTGILVKLQRLIVLGEPTPVAWPAATAVRQTK